MQLLMPPLMSLLVNCFKLQTRFSLMMSNTKQRVTAKQATQKQHHDKVTTNVSRHYCLHTRIPWSTQVDTSLIMVNLTMAELWNITYTSYVLEKSLLRLFLHQLRTTLSDSVDIYPYSPSALKLLLYKQLLIQLQRNLLKNSIQIALHLTLMEKSFLTQGGDVRL